MSEEWLPPTIVSELELRGRFVIGDRRTFPFREPARRRRCGDVRRGPVRPPPTRIAPAALPEVPLLVHDDGSRVRLERLCRRYSCDFEHNEQRASHRASVT